MIQWWSRTVLRKSAVKQFHLAREVFDAEVLAILVGADSVIRTLGLTTVGYLITDLRWSLSSAKTTSALVRDMRVNSE